MNGVKKNNPFIRVDSRSGLSPEFFRVFDDGVVPLIERRLVTVPHSDVLFNRIPRLLLRPLYGLEIKRGKERKNGIIPDDFVDSDRRHKPPLLLQDGKVKDLELISKTFDTFSSHIDYVRKNFERNDQTRETFLGVFQFLLRKEEFEETFLFGFSKKVVEELTLLIEKVTLVDDQQKISHQRLLQYTRKIVEDFSIFLVLFFRIYFLSRQIKHMSKLFQSDAYYDIHHNLNLFLDTHIPLSSMILSYHLYRDDELYNHENNRFHIYRPVIVQFFPKDLDFIEHSDTFDLWQPIYNSGRKCQENERGKNTNGIYNAFSQKIFTKIGVFTCQKRSLDTAISDIIRRFPDVFDFIKRCIFISLSGNFEYSKCRPTFPVRCILWSLIFGPDNKFEKEIFDFVLHYEVTLLYILREFIVYFCSVDLVYSEFIRNFIKQDQIELLIKRFMETVRGKLEASMKDVVKNQSESEQVFDPFISLSRENCLGLVESYTREKYTEFLPFGSKFSRYIPEIYFFRTMEMKHKEENEDKYSKINEKDTHFISNERLLNIFSVVEHIHDTGAMHLREFFYTKWLKYLGVTKESFHFIRNLYYRYCCEDLPDNSIPKEMRKLWGMNRRDFHIIRIYLKHLIERFNFIRYSLPHEIYLIQKECNERKMNILFPLSSTLSSPYSSSSMSATHHYCYYCKNCMRWANNVIKPNDPNAKRTMSSFTPSSCAIDIVTGNLVCLRATDVKFQSNEKKKQQRKEDMLKLNTMEKKEERKSICSKTPLQSVNMNGLIQKIGKVFYCKCTLCDCLMEFNAFSFGVQGLTCGNHNDGVVSSIGPSSKEFHSVEFLSSSLTFQELNNEKCFFCNVNSNWNEHLNCPRNRMYNMKVIDDVRSKPPCVSDIFLCKEHFQRYLGKKNLPFLSDVKLALSRDFSFKFEKKWNKQWNKFR